MGRSHDRTKRRFQPPTLQPAEAGFVCVDAVSTAGCCIAILRLRIEIVIEKSQTDEYAQQSTRRQSKMKQRSRALANHIPHRQLHITRWRSIICGLCRSFGDGLFGGGSCGGRLIHNR